MHADPSRFARQLALVFLLPCACTMTRNDAEPLREVTDDEAFALSVGERVGLADASTLHYMRVVEDSRCPPDVQCVWAGLATVSMQWRPAEGDSLAFQLTTRSDGNSMVLGRRRLTLEALGRDAAAQATLRVAPVAP